MTIEADFAHDHPGSAALAERARRALPSGVTHDARFLRPFPIYVDSAAGAHKRDVDGHDYIDYVMGHGALLLGHSHPVVTSAALGQLQRGTHYGAGHENEVLWAEQVIRLIPSAEAVRFTSSGTEATLMAIRLARTATDKPVVVKFEHHFHGWHDYVAANSKYAGSAPAGVPQSTMDSVVVIPATIEAFQATLTSRHDIAAVIVEAAGASSGSEPLPEGFLHALRAATERRGVVLIFDEVVTGFRWSPGGVQQLEGVTPDITALAKILAGGFPGGAVAGRRDLLDHMAFPEPGQPKRAKVGHPGTFNANPLSAAAGVACLHEIADGSHQQRANELAARLRAGMNGELCRLGLPGVVYGQTSDLRIRLGVAFHAEATDYDPRALPPSLFESPSNPEADRLLQLALLNRGVYFFGTGGFTSSAHSDEDIERTVATWGESLEALAAEAQV